MEGRGEEWECFSPGPPAWDDGGGGQFSGETLKSFLLNRAERFGLPLETGA